MLYRLANYQIPTLPSFDEALQDANKARMLFDASKGGNVRGITEDHRFMLADVFNCPKRRRDATDLALAAIWVVLNADGIAGWNDWSSYAAAGEWI